MGAQAVRLSNTDIDNALKNKDFEILFQPVFDLGNGAVARVEAFIRWRHPSLGVLPPGAFISFFESQGRMSELTRYVLKQALAQYVAWRGPSGPGFSVNLALSDLADQAFASHFSVLMREGGFPADLITLECPMPPVTMPVETAAQHFARLAATGARLAIEVRGRANDFLRSIEPFPFDEIKTGGAAILRFARTVRGPGLSAISELLEIANNANAAITAVGVEDQASLAALRSLGFAAAQGNHLAKVGPISEFSPERVNDVRKLLGLEPLSKEDLQALFRTEAPAPQQSAAEEPKAIETSSDESAPTPDKDALVQRLAARLARRAEVEAAALAKEGEAATPRPKLIAAKAAAIAKAKRKAAERNVSDQVQNEAEETAQADPIAARLLQERLAQEFGSPARGASAPMAGKKEDTPDDDDDLDIAFADEEAPAVEKDAATLEEAAAASIAEETNAAAEAPAEQAAEIEETPAVAASAAGGFVRASLAVGKTGAYFRPGMHITAVEPLVSPAAAPAAQPVKKEEAAPTAADETGDLHAEGDAAAASEAIATEAAAVAARIYRPRRRKKNILTRKYRLMPTHFWPRSWKRAWQRRTAEAAERRRERLEEKASEAVAE